MKFIFNKAVRCFTDETGGGFTFVSHTAHCFTHSTAPFYILIGPITVLTQNSKSLHLFIQFTKNPYGYRSYLLYKNINKNIKVIV